jgi:uncharacterized membrane protein
MKRGIPMTTQTPADIENGGNKQATPEQKNIVLLVYILQAASFLVGVTAIAALILAYIKREEMRGTWLESHINWQIKTFWYGLLGFIGVLLLVVLIGGFILLATAIWVIFRIVKGWLAYSEGKSVPDGLF